MTVSRLIEFNNTALLLLRIRSSRFDPLLVISFFCTPFYAALGGYLCTQFSKRQARSLGNYRIKSFKMQNMLHCTDL